MIKSNMLIETEARKVVDRKGCFTVVEYEKDISISPDDAQSAYFRSEMNFRKRQVVANLNGNGVIIQAGAMQLMLGSVDAGTNVKGAGDLMKKFIGSKVTGESAIKPHYHGNGTLVLEPTYRYIILEDLADWDGQMVIEDGMFLACEETVDMKVTARSNISSAVLGGEGLFNTALTGSGVAVLESYVPREELVIVELENDVLKIDGNMAIAWSNTLEFTVERTTKTLVGSAASGEGFVNVYRGTGRVLIALVDNNKGISLPIPSIPGLKKQ